MTKVTKIEYLPETDDLTIWFDRSDEPFGLREFAQGSETRIALETAIYHLSNAVYSIENAHHD
jgi:hypothetical protein